MSSKIFRRRPWTERASSERMEEVLIDIAGPEDHIGHDVIELLRKISAQFAALQLRRREHPDRLEKGQSDFGERPELELAVHAGEQRILRAVDADGKNLRICQMGDDAWALIDLHKRTGDCYSAFRKDHNFPTPLQCPDERFQRQRIGRIDGNDIEEEACRLHPPFRDDVAVDGKMAAVGDEHREQRTIEKRLMVGHDHSAAAGGTVVFQPSDFDTIKKAQYLTADILDELLRKKEHAQGGSKSIEECKQQETRP